MRMERAQLNKKIIVGLLCATFFTLPFTSKINANLDAAVNDENEFHRTIDRTVQSAINFYELGPSDSGRIKKAFDSPEGIIRVTRKEAYMRVKAGTQYRAVGKAAPIGDNYTYYDTKYVGKIKWFKVLKPNTINQYYWISGYCVTIVTNKEDEVPNDYERMLDAAVKQYFTHKQDAYDEMKWSQLKPVLVRNTGLYRAEHQKFKVYRKKQLQPKLVSYKELNRLMLSEEKYWVRTVERYAIKNKKDEIRQLYYASEYLVERKQGDLYFTKRTSNVVKKFEE